MPGNRFRIGSGLRLLDRAAYVVSSFMFLAFTAMVAWNVISRNLFDRPVPWAEESGITVLVLLVFLIQLSLEIRGDQLNVGLLTMLLKSKTARRIHLAVRGLLTMGVFALLGRAGWRVVQQNIDLGSETPVVGVPLAFIFGFVAFVMSLIILIWVFLILLQGWKVSSE